ncbi:MAG: HD domain-containing protein [Lachnospiraceae bacterium]|nr:HD domain-containing protein [Lachnospiraceae bacterium]
MQKNGCRTDRQAKQWKQKYAKQRRLYKEIKVNAPDILTSPNFNSTRGHIQHGNMTVNAHCMNVAKYSLAISDKLEKLGIHCKRNELIRGALLHDYFLYDWHDADHRQPHKLHGFYHPGIALKNASREYDLTPREQDIIRKHMWPLTVIPPTCREAWIVTTADKWCSLLETIRIHKGHGVHRYG